MYIQREALHESWQSAAIQHSVLATVRCRNNIIVQCAAVGIAVLMLASRILR